MTPEEASKAVLMQSWMTFLTVLFGYLALTEVYDETELMICKPRAYMRVVARRLAIRRAREQYND